MEEETNIYFSNENKQNSFLSMFNIWDLLENYGWYILLISIILMYILRKLQPVLDLYWKEQADKEYAAKYHKDSDMVAARIVAQQAATERLQNKYSEDAKIFKNKLEEKERKKRELLANQPCSSGRRLGNSNEKQQSLKPDYNPLVGDTTNHSYRPERRTPCSGGRCGK